MNKKFVLKIFFLVIFLIVAFVPNCYASSGTVSVNKTTAKAGEEIELYINLEIESIAYDLKIAVNDSSLIESSEVVNKIGSGSTSRIYLVQIAPESDRTVYPSGTRIATIKYVLKDDISEDKTLTFTVSGDIAGRSSSDKNTMNETVSISVSPKSADPADPAKPTDPTDSADPADPAKPTDPTDPADPADPANPADSAKPTEPTDPKPQNLKDDEKDKGLAPKLPNTGKEIGILLIIVGILLLQIPIVIAYKKTKTK